MDNYDEYDDNDVVEVASVDEPKLDWWTRTLLWAKDHKVIVCCSIIGLPLLAIILGGKIFSKTIEVEKQPDPTIWDNYDPVPVRSYTTTEFEYRPKDAE